MINKISSTNLFFSERRWVDSNTLRNQLFCSVAQFLFSIEVISRNGRKLFRFRNIGIEAKQLVIGQM